MVIRDDELPAVAELGAAFRRRAGEQASARAHTTLLVLALMWLSGALVGILAGLVIAAVLLHG